MDKRTRTSDNDEPDETEGNSDYIAMAECSDEVKFSKELRVSRNGNDDRHFLKSDRFLLLAEIISAAVTA